MSKIRFVLMTMFVILSVTTFAQAVQYRFKNITNNSSVDAAIGEAQLLLDIIETDPGQALFTFSNVGPDNASITDIYIDQDASLLLNMIFNTTDAVKFSEDPSPNNLPGGNALEPPFVADHCVSVDSDSPVQLMGINPYESLSILYDLTPGTTFTNLIDGINEELLRIGLHVQGFDDEGSESFVNVPEPGTIGFLALTCLILVRHTRR